MSFTFYEVGGKVRDELMGLQSKDIDYVAVPDKYLIDSRLDAASLFVLLDNHLMDRGYEIFLTTPHCFTIRAKFPKGHKHEGTVADFVMARKELGYEPGTRKPIVVPGTLLDDLLRRDFTVNAIARDMDGNFIDPLDGRTDLKIGYLKTPLDAEFTMNDDPLRILRAIRFSITKGFRIMPELSRVIKHYDYDQKMHVVSTERIREELYKALKYDSLKTMQTLLMTYHRLGEYIFEHTDLWLKPTNES